MNRRDLLIAPVCEAALIAVAGCMALLLHRPLLFASLGPTAYEMIETPSQPSARPYNVVVGHLIGVACGFAALALTHAAHEPAVSTSIITAPRVLAAVIASLLTVAVTLLLRAQQPAAVSTTLMIATGSMQRPRDAVAIMAAILLMTALGEPIRLWRLRQVQPARL